VRGRAPRHERRDDCKNCCYVPWFDAVFKGGRASEGAYLEHSTQNCTHADTVAARSRFANSTAPARKPALARLSEPPPPASLTARSARAAMSALSAIAMRMDAGNGVSAAPGGTRPEPVRVSRGLFM